jgi:hypothetical protein
LKRERFESRSACASQALASVPKAHGGYFRLNPLEKVRDYDDRLNLFAVSSYIEPLCFPFSTRQRIGRVDNLPRYPTLPVDLYDLIARANVHLCQGCSRRGNCADHEIDWIFLIKASGASPTVGNRTVAALYCGDADGDIGSNGWGMKGEMPVGNPLWL